MLHEGKDWVFDDEANVLQIKDGVKNIEWETITEFQHGRDMYNYKEFEVILPNTIHEITTDAFSHVKLAKIIIPDSVVQIGERVFFDAAYLKEVSISSKVYSIGSQTFAYCYNLRKVKILEGVKEIGILAFAGCRSLTKIVLPATIKYICHNAFHYCDNLKELYVPTVMYDACKSFCEKNYPNITAIPYEGSIDDILLDDSDNITEITNTNRASTNTCNKFKSFSGAIRTNLMANKKKQ